MGEDPLYHDVQCTLLLEDDTSKVKENLVPFDLQQTPLIDLSVPQTQATELQISFKHMTVVLTEVAIIVFVDNLKILTLLRPVKTKINSFPKIRLDWRLYFIDFHLRHPNYWSMLVLYWRTHHGLCLVSSHVVNIRIKPKITWKISLKYMLNIIVFCDKIDLNSQWLKNRSWPLKLQLSDISHFSLSPKCTSLSQSGRGKIFVSIKIFGWEKIFVNAGDISLSSTQLALI